MAVWAVSIVSFGLDILNELTIVVFQCDYVRFSVLQPSVGCIIQCDSIRRDFKTNQFRLKNTGDEWK